MRLFDTYKGLRKEMYVLFFGRVMTNLGSMIFPMLTMILSEKMHMSASQIADYFLVISIVQIPANLIGGRLADRFNRIKVIIACDLISVIGYLYCGLTELNSVSLVIVGVASIFQTMEWPAYDALSADFSTPKERERAFSLMYFGANLGLILAPTIGGALFNNYLWLAFIINAVAILSSTILIFFKIKTVEQSADEEDVNIYESKVKENTSLFSLIFNNKVLFLYIFYCALYNMAYSQYNYLMPLDVVKAHPETGSLIFGTLTSVNCITVVVMTAFITAKLIRKKETDKMILGGVLVMAGYLIFAVFLKYVAVSYLALFIFTLGEIVTTISSGPFVSKRIAANFRGRVNSVYGVIGTIAGALFNKLVGVVYDAKGSASAWALTILICAILVVILFIMKQVDRKQYVELYK